MSEKTMNSSRRAFFLRGGAALGTGVVATVGASAAPAEKRTPLEEQLSDLRRELQEAQDRTAIRQLHLDFAALIEQQDYERAAQLFAERGDLDLSGERAQGRSAIQQLFERKYRDQTASVIHSAYRQNASHQSNDVLQITAGQARATFHVDAQLSTPLQEDCTAAKMARLQGQVADRRWQAGRLEGQYVKRGGEWKIASLKYLAA
ncbi:MAG TPA: nuclear transport factor 2 family protein [Steroidobacteraceae bacterium]|nr:nuclear transport factor 2 family protein [Steroidobacteraceae bacterium]